LRPEGHPVVQREAAAVPVVLAEPVAVLLPVQLRDLPTASRI